MNRSGEGSWNRSRSVSEIGPPLYSLAPTTVNPAGSDTGGGSASCGDGKMHLQANLLLNSLLLREKQEAALRSVDTMSTAIASVLSAAKPPPIVTAVSS